MSRRAITAMIFLIDIFIVLFYTKYHMLIRPACLEEVRFASEMMSSSMGRHGDFQLGFGDHERTLKVLEAFFIRRKNHFSHRYTEIAEMINQPAGLLVSYPSRILRSFYLNMGLQIWSIYGFKDSLRMIRLQIGKLSSREAGPGEYYIGHLAVQADFQRKGIGRALMNHAERRARGMGLRKCSLMVDQGNDNARSLYVDIGYQVIESISTPEHAHQGLTGYERMVKNL